MSTDAPKKSLFRFFRFPLLLFFGLLVTMGGLIAFNTQWIRIQSVQIDMVDGSQEDQIFQRIRQSLNLQTAALTGKLFWQVPLKDVYEMALKDKRVKHVDVFREFPSSLRLVIEPHTPVLAYLAKDHRIYPVARDATLLPPLSAKEIPDLPILRGDELKDKPALREEAIDLFEQIPDDGPLRKHSLSEIYFSKKDGFKVFISGADAEVRMGDTDFGPKVSRVQKVLAYLESQNIKGRVIDARYNKKVVVRVRKAP
jgi:cell division septal protein FtsQ